MAEHEIERFVNAKLSVAMLAYTGNLADYIDTRVLMVINKDGRAGPVAGKKEKGEHPFVALKREWVEETGGEPFIFQNGYPKFKDTVYTETPDGLNIGFIYHGRLTDDSVEIFEKGKLIKDDEDIIKAKLYNIDEVLVVLRDWEKQLTHPEINAQTLINVVNNVMVNHDEYTASPLEPESLFGFKDFGMDFVTTSLSFGID